MFFKRMIGLVALACIGACSETPVAPPSEKPQPYQFPQVAQNPTSPFAAPVVIPTGPRVEVYSHGVLKGIIGGVTAGPSGAAAFENFALPAGFSDVLDQITRRPVNKRTIHLAALMRTIGNAPAAARGKAVEAMARQLLRETEHRDTTLADGTHVLEYYFDGQIATRVILPKSVNASRRSGFGLTAGVDIPIGRETVTDPDACTADCGYDPAYDAMLYASFTWIIDQIEALSEDVAVLESTDGAEVYAKLCLSQIASWVAAVAAAGANAFMYVESWGTWSVVQKQLGLSSAYGLLNGLYSSWLAMHSCFHA